MKRNALMLIIIIAAIVGALAVSSAATSPTIVTSNDLTWKPIPGVTGASLAVVWGDPSKAAPYIERIQMVDGVKFPPHWHPQDERVTVLSGTLLFGTGDTINTANAKSLGAGSFVFIPHGVHHYAVSQGPTIIQVSGMGPDTLNPVK